MNTLPEPLSLERAAELQALIDEVEDLSPLSEEEEREETPPKPKDHSRGGGNWKSQPKESLLRSERDRLKRRMEKSGLHRTAAQCGVSHATITKAVKGAAIVEEKITSIRRGLQEASLPKPSRSAPPKPLPGEPLSQAEQQLLAVFLGEERSLLLLKKSCALSAQALRKASQGGNLLRPNLERIREALREMVQRASKGELVGAS